MEECRAELDKMANENFELLFRLGRKDAHVKELEERLEHAEETLDYLLSLVRKRKRPADPADMVVEEAGKKAEEDSTPSVSRVTPAPVEEEVRTSALEEKRSSAPVVEERSSAPVEVEEERSSAPSGEDVTSPVGEDVPSKTNDAMAPQENNAAPIPLASTSETMGPPPPPNIPAVTLQPPTPQTSQEEQAGTTHLVPPKDPAETARARSRSRSRSPARQLVEQRRSPRLNSPGLPPSPQPSSKRSGEPLDNEPPAKKARDC